MTTPANLSIKWQNTGTGLLQLFPNNTISSVQVGLIDLGTPPDFGEIPFTAFQEARVMLDGLSFYGGVFSVAREIVLPLWCRCGSAAGALNQINLIDKWFRYANLKDMKLTVARDDGSSGTLTTWIRGYMKSRRAFVNFPAPGVGVIGNMANGDLLYVVTLVCPYPHLRTTAATSVSGNWTGTSVPKTVTVNGPNPVGLILTVTPAVAVTSVTVTNTTTGRYITITDSFAASVVADWYGTDPDVLTVKRGATDLMGNINVGALLVAQPGDNSFAIHGAGTSFSFDLSWYDSYDSI